MEPIVSAPWAVQAVRREVLSARPDAPVILPRPHREEPRAVTRQLRAFTARALRHAADAVEPRPRPQPSLECCGATARC